MLYPGNLHIACAGGCERQAKARAVYDKNVHGGEDCSCKTINVQYKCGKIFASFIL